MTNGKWQMANYRWQDGREQGERRLAPLRVPFTICYLIFTAPSLDLPFAILPFAILRPFLRVPPAGRLAALYKNHALSECVREIRRVAEDCGLVVLWYQFRLPSHQAVGQDTQLLVQAGTASPWDRSNDPVLARGKRLPNRDGPHLC